MNAINELVGKAIAEVKEQPTKDEPMITPGAQQFDWKFETLCDPKLEGLLNAAKRFVSSIQLNETPHWLSILGPSGIGKTHTGRAVLRFWRERAGWHYIPGKAGDVANLKESRFVSWRKFMDRQRNGEYYEMDAIAKLPFAMIDDIGAEHDPTGFAKGKLDMIADQRLGKWTVFTSNLLLHQIAEQIDPRISSRMLRAGSIVIEITVPDYNLRKGNTQ